MVFYLNSNGAPKRGNQQNKTTVQCKAIHGPCQSACEIFQLPLHKKSTKQNIHVGIQSLVPIPLLLRGCAVTILYETAITFKKHLL